MWGRRVRNFRWKKKDQRSTRHNFYIMGWLLPGRLLLLFNVTSHAWDENQWKKGSLIVFFEALVSPSPNEPFTLWSVSAPGLFDLTGDQREVKYSREKTVRIRAWIFPLWLSMAINVIKFFAIVRERYEYKLSANYILFRVKQSKKLFFLSFI